MLNQLFVLGLAFTLVAFAWAFHRNMCIFCLKAGAVAGRSRRASHPETLIDM